MIFGMIFGVGFLVLCLAVIIAMIRQWKYRMILATILGASILILVVIGMFIPKEKASTRTDKDMVMEFCQSIMQKTSEVDQLYDPITKAIERGDVIETAKICLQIKEPISLKWSGIGSVSVPTLQNKEVEKQLNEAKERLSNAYLMKITIVDTFLKYIDGPKPSVLASFHPET